MLLNFQFWCEVTNIVSDTLSCTANYFKYKTANLSLRVLLFFINCIENLITFISDEYDFAHYNVVPINATENAVPTVYNKLLLSAWHSLHTQFIPLFSDRKFDMSFISLFGSQETWPFQITAVCYNIRSATRYCRGKCETVNQYCKL